MNNFEVKIQSDKQGVQGVPWSHSNACAGRKVNSEKRVVRKEARVLGQGGRRPPLLQVFLSNNLQVCPACYITCPL